jgi:hypothetical protein
MARGRGERVIHERTCAFSSSAQAIRRLPSPGRGHRAACESAERRDRPDQVCDALDAPPVSSRCAFDGTALSLSQAAARARLAETTHLVVSIAPDDSGRPGPRHHCGKMILHGHAGAALDRLPVDGGRLWRPWRRLGRRRGECRPAGTLARFPARGRTPNGRRSAAKARRSVAILRLSGIYGPGRNAFVNLANGTARRLIKPGQVFNRIHVDDIAGALCNIWRHDETAACSTSPTTSRRRRRT